MLDTLNPHQLHAQSALRDINYINPTNCAFKVTASGETIETGSGLSVSTRDQRTKALRICASMGVTLGSNGRARQQSLSDLRAFFQQTLQNSQ